MLDAYNASMASVMRAHLRTRDVMFNILGMHSLHLLLCFPLMRGWGSIPAFGLVGFALALGLSRAFGLSLITRERQAKTDATRLEQQFVN